ncbi:MAG: HvfC/BufC family peptide modification chaperone [Silanimonas sp.]
MQAEFAAALFDASRIERGAAPPGLASGSERRFAVHRNTMMSSLVRALADGFPSVERLVGPEFFAAMAALHVRAHPPRHPVLLAWGTAFPDFIEGFEPVAHLPYLADVARLDGLRRRAWHALDVAPLDLAQFEGVDADAIAEHRIALHPSVGVLGSAHPARTLWAAQNGDDEPGAVDWQAETSVVWRSGGAIHVDALDAPLCRLLDRARRMPTLAELLAADADTDAPTDGHAIASAFATALRSGLLVDAKTLAEATRQAIDATLFDDFLPPFPTASTDETSP